MGLNKEKAIIQLSNDVLREIKLSDFLCEETANIKKLEGINWRYKNKQYTVSLISLKQSYVHDFINIMANKKILSKELSNRKIQNIGLTNSKIKKLLKVKKQFNDGKEENIKFKDIQEFKEAFLKEIAQDDKNKIEKYVVEKDLYWINSNSKYELIKNINFSNIKLHNVAAIKSLSKLNEEAKLSLIKNKEIKQIINSDRTLIFLDKKEYLSLENKQLIDNIYNKIDKNIHKKIYFVICGKEEQINRDKIQQDIVKYLDSKIMDSEELKCAFLDLEKIETAASLIGDLGNEELKQEFISKYKIKADNQDDYEELKRIINIDLLNEKLEQEGMIDFKDEIVEGIYIEARNRFIQDSMKSLGGVLEGVCSRINSKMNILNRNNTNLYELSEDIKREISKIDLDSVSLKDISENEFKELEDKIQRILKAVKNNIIVGMESSLIKDENITSYDKDSLETIVKELQTHTLSTAQMVVDKEIDKIKMLLMETQYKIYIESQYRLNQESQKKLKPVARNKFNELVKEFTKTNAEDSKVVKIDFETQSYIEKFQKANEYMYSENETIGTYTETVFDSSAATIGTISFGLAGATLGAVAGLVIPELSILISIFISGVATGIVGFFITSKKEIVKEKEAKLYKVDTKVLKSDINEILDKIVLDITKYVIYNFKSFKVKHMNFLESDMNKYLCCIAEDSGKILDSHKSEMNDMIDLKFKVDGYVKTFAKIKDGIINHR